MHIPFCESLCLFCACNVVIEKNKAVSPPYLGILKREAERVSRGVSKDRPVVQFHWGGGTPTYLTPPQIEDLFGFTREHFHFAPDAEIGIEIDLASPRASIWKLSADSASTASVWASRIFTPTCRKPSIAFSRSK